MTASFSKLRSKVFELCRQSKYEDAIALCRTKLGKTRNADDRIGILLLIPYILDCAGRLSESKEALRSIIDADPLNRGAQYHLLLVLIELGNLKRAIEAADQLVEIDTRFPFQSFTSSAYFHKAYAACKLKRFKQAKAALDKSEEMGAIWIDRRLISRKQLMSCISRKKFDLT
ncbi:MAG: tetratricopeptide repeat protein [Pseudomonadota bacterium]